MKADKHIYIDDYTSQVNKKNNFVCGDYAMIKRNPEYTDFVLCDGMGSGPKANMSAIMCANRILGLMENGVSIYRACEKAVELMHRARTEDIPFAAFSIVRINKHGHYTALSFEIPPPVIVKEKIAEVCEQRFFACAHEVVSESIGRLGSGDSLIFVSDGVSQAGLGIMSGSGWGIEGFEKFININLVKGLRINEIAEKTLKQTHRLSGRVHADDTTVAVLSAKNASIINILSGPPADRGMDAEFVKAFMKRTGSKIICGSTTAGMAARELGEEVQVSDISTSFHEPPRYHIGGIDIVSEGAVTLNQIYNILDIDMGSISENSVVFDIAKMLLSADIINIYMGDAKNTAHQDTSFKQIGIAERAVIVKLLIEKLTKMGKVVRIIKPSEVIGKGR
ncbi:MAG: SpoIIE family protein phosphatase [Eubacteriales bacterium]